MHQESFLNAVIADVKKREQDENEANELLDSIRQLERQLEKSLSPLAELGVRTAVDVVREDKLLHTLERGHKFDARTIVVTIDKKSFELKSRIVSLGTRDQLQFFHEGTDVVFKATPIRVWYISIKGGPDNVATPELIAAALDGIYCRAEAVKPSF